MPIAMKAITTNVPAAAPIAPLPPANAPLTTVAMAPAATVGTVQLRSVRTSLDCMGAAPPAGVGGRGVVGDERNRGWTRQRTCLTPEDRRTQVFRLVSRVS